MKGMFGAYLCLVESEKKVINIFPPTENRAKTERKGILENFIYI